MTSPHKKQNPTVLEESIGDTLDEQLRAYVYEDGRQGYSLRDQSADRRAV